MGDRLATVDMGQKEGAAAVPLLGRELGPNITQCGLGRGLPPTSTPSGILIHPAVGDNTPTLQIGQTGTVQQSDGIGQTVLQTVAQKRFTLCYWAVVCPVCL